MKITAPAPIRTYIIAGNTFDADAVMDGNYDRTGLPDPLVLTFHFALAGDHIAQLIIVHNQPTPNWANA
jgi:hypothetical protein